MVLAREACEPLVPGLPGNICLLLSSEYPLNIKGLRQSRGDSNRIPGRRHDIDALRVLAFGLLIIYHVGMFYVADWDYHVKSSYQVEWLQVPMVFSNQWRMPLIFLISGLAVNFAWGKYRPHIFALRRVWRLLVPLVFGMAIIIAPQNYYEALSNGIIDRGFWDFFEKYLTGYDFPPRTYGGDDSPGWTCNHLWYLPYLLTYTLVLIPLAMLLDGPGRLIRDACQQARGIGLIVVPIIPLVAYRIVVFPHFPFFNHALFGDWYAHALYSTVFVYGYLIGRDAGVWTEILRLRWITLGLASVCFTVGIALLYPLPEEPSFWSELGINILIPLNMWLWILTVLGWGRRLLNDEFRWSPYATEAVYPWYILHQTILLSAGYELARLKLGFVLESTVLLFVTFSGCFLIHEFIVRRHNVLRVLFGLHRKDDMISSSY